MKDSPRKLTDMERYAIAQDTRRDVEIARAYAISTATVINCRKMLGIIRKGEMLSQAGIRTLTVDEWIAELRGKRCLKHLLHTR